MKRVAVTTHRYEAVAPAYTACGLEPVSLPCVRVEVAPEEVLASVREAVAATDVVVVSSIATLDLLWPEGSMPAVRVAAVGEASAAKAEAMGGRLLARGREGLADLVDRLELGSLRVVFPHAGDVDPLALSDLRRRAPRLQEYEVYRTVSIAPESDEVRAVSFASPSAVRGWLLSRRLEGLVIGAIGPTTRSEVVRHRPVDVMAPRPSHPSLAQALADHLEVAS